METTLAVILQRLEALNTRIDTVDARFDSLKERLDFVENRLLDLTVEVKSTNRRVEAFSNSFADFKGRTKPMLSDFGKKLAGF